MAPPDKTLSVLIKPRTKSALRTVYYYFVINAAFRAYNKTIFSRYTRVRAHVIITLRFLFLFFCFFLDFISFRTRPLKRVQPVPARCILARSVRFVVHRVFRTRDNNNVAARALETITIIVTVRSPPPMVVIEFTSDAHVRNHTTRY